VRIAIVLMTMRLSSSNVEQYRRHEADAQHTRAIEGAQFCDYELRGRFRRFKTNRLSASLAAELAAAMEACVKLECRRSPSWCSTLAAYMRP
jgi:hypothetical protein